MMILESTIEGIDTTGIPKIIPFAIICDPYEDTNPNGGRRKDLAKLVSATTRVAIVAASEERLQDAKTLMRHLVGMNFNSNARMKIIEVTTAEECIDSLNGKNRTKGSKKKSSNGTPPRNNNMTANDTTSGMTPGGFN
mmetsp:Transcript_12242/g.29161  ORF Transcript_12242/g.29161 Transcript_12242/m.29161 type:complete len:138 (+) Transcript_12242:575-988(+)